MRRSANLSAEKLVGEYLGRVMHAAQRVLPKGDRLLFVARTRASIMKKVGPLAAADPSKVLEILTDLGDPRTMAKKELERLETAHRGGPPKPVVIWKPVKDEWKPAKADTQPIQRQPPAPPTAPPPTAPPSAAPPSPAAPSAAQRPAGAQSPGAQSPGAQAPEARSAEARSAEARSAAPPSAAQQPGAAPRAGLPVAGASPAGPPPAGPSSAGPQAPALAGTPPEPAGAGPGPPDGDSPPVAPAPAPPTVRALVRSHPLETVAVVLLGVGGLIIPFIWLAGALVAVASRVWDARDKWLALLGTPVFLFVALLAAGVLVGGKHGFFPEFIHAFDAYREYLLRAGAVLSAVYLAWRIRQGPRIRSLPPWQRPQRAGPGSGRTRH